MKLRITLSLLFAFTVISLFFLGTADKTYINNTTQNTASFPAVYYSHQPSATPISSVTTLPASLPSSVTEETTALFTTAAGIFSSIISIDTAVSKSTPSVSDFYTKQTMTATSTVKISSLTPSPTISPTVLPTVTPVPGSIQSILKKWPVPSAADQIILVIGNGSSASISMFKKSNSDWVGIMSSDGYAGKSGVGQTSEGSNYTPKGVYTLTKAFGIAPDPGTILPYTLVDSSHYWIDDPASKYYNQLVSTKNTEKDWKSAEHLIDMQKEYKYSIVIDYNLDCIPGAGSAFFLHCESGSATAGCIAVPESKMLFIMKNISANAYIIILDKSDIY